MVRTPLRSPTTDVAVPPTFEPRQPPLVSWHFFLLAPQASVPISADHCLLQKAPECNALPARSQIPVSFFADFLLRLALSGVPPARLQPQKTTYLATLQKPVGVFYLQDIRQRDLRSYTLHLLQQGHFRVHFLGDFLHPPVVFLDALVQRFDFFEQRLQNIPQLCAQFSGQLPAHLLRATLGQPFTIRLHQPACCVHQGRSSTHQFSSRPDYRQMDLRFRVRSGVGRVFGRKTQRASGLGPYNSRNAFIGSSRTARHAGRALATTDRPSNTAPAARIVAGSDAEMPYRKSASTRDTIQKTPSPNTTPTNAIVSPRRKIN